MHFILNSASCNNKKHHRMHEALKMHLIKSVNNLSQPWSMEIGPNFKQGVARDQHIHIHLAVDPET